MTIPCVPTIKDKPEPPPMKPPRRGMTLQDRINAYCATTGYPRNIFLGEDGRIVGTWIMGNNYTVKSGLYGGYPHGYLKRIRALFPDKTNILHLFSGCVDLISDGHTREDPRKTKTACAIPGRYRPA